MTENEWKKSVSDKLAETIPKSDFTVRSYSETRTRSSYNLFKVVVINVSNLDSVSLDTSTILNSCKLVELDLIILVDKRKNYCVFVDTFRNHGSFFFLLSYMEKALENYNKAFFLEKYINSVELWVGDFMSVPSNGIPPKVKEAYINIGIHGSFNNYINHLLNEYTI